MELQSQSMSLIEPLAPNAEWVHESSAQVGFFIFFWIDYFNHNFSQCD